MQESGAITVMLPPVAMGPETIWRPGVVLHVRPPQVTPPRELLTPMGRGDTEGLMPALISPTPGQALTGFRMAGPSFSSNGFSG